jgi:hypothetical protein
LNKISCTIECSPNLSRELAGKLSKISGEEIDQVERDNLDGSPTTIVLIFQLVATVVTAAAPLIVPYVLNGGVKKIRIKRVDGSEVEIENPTREQVEREFSKNSA